MTIQIVVVGAGGLGREICDVVEDINRVSPSSYELVGVLDDAPTEKNLLLLEDRGIAFLGGIADFAAQRSDSGSVSYIVGIASPGPKTRIANVLAEAGFNPVSLIHPDATIGSRVQIGVGTVVRAGARVGTNARLGAHNHVGFNAIVGHDVVAGDFVSIHPLALISGGARLENSTTIGGSAFVRQNLVVGEGSVVGGCACVIRDVPAGTTVLGVPAQ